MTVLLNQTHPWIFTLMALAAIAGTVWFYRRVPPPAARIRTLLLTLRVLALALLVLALLEPVLALSRTAMERPVVGVLLDGSRSMAIRDGTGGARRGDEAVALLNEVMLPRIARDAELVAFRFSSETEEVETERGELAKPSGFDGGATDIALAIETLRDRTAGRNLSALVIATDGANNRGAGPYEEALSTGVPVFALGVGSAEAGTDIAIEDAVTNRISYTGESVPVEVIVSSSGYAGAETTVELSENDVLLDSRQIELSGTGEETRVSFRVTPSVPGTHRYSVSIPVAENELSSANNSRIVVTTAMKGKIRALLAAERPSWDVAFLRRELEEDRSVEVEAVVRRRGSPASPTEGSAPGSKEELFGHDLVVLVEPDWDDPIIAPEWLGAFVRDRGGGLMVLGRGDGVPPDDVAGVLPYVAGTESSAVTVETRVRLTDEGETSPATRVVEDRFANAEVWRALPPVRVAGSSPPAPRAGFDVIVRGSGTDGEPVPVVLAGRAGPGNVMAVLADGLWRWKMARGGDVDVYDRFATNAARWLTARGELERVMVTPDKDVFQAGEEIGFSAQVYRGDFRPATGAEVAVSVASGEGAAPVATVDLVPTGEHYRGSVGHLPPGPYVLRAEAALNGEEIGSATAEFIVERFSLEDAETRRRSATLRRIAEETGGGYYTPEILGDLPDEVPLAWRERRTTRELELWNSPWLLLGFVGLLSVEWALRRKAGLP